MSSSTAIVDATLQSALTEITDIDRQVAELNDKIDVLKGRRDHLERVALEEMQTQRLDGVRVGGRSWRIEWTHSFSAPEAKKQAVIEAAQRAGLLEKVTQINTARLKALLTEKAKEAGTDARQPYSAGTEFEGIVGEFVAPRLRHLTVS